MLSAITYLYRRLSLRVALIVPFLLLIVLGIGLTGWLSLQNSSHAINEVTLQLRKEISTRIKEHLDYYLSIPQTINLHALSELNTQLETLQQPNNIIQHIIHQLKAYPQVSHMQIGMANGDMVGVERGKDGFFRLELANQSTRHKLQVYRIDDKGEYVSEMPIRVIPSYDPRELEWYRKAATLNASHWNIQAGKSQWSQVFNFLGDTWLALNYSTPIFSPDGELLAVISSDVVLDKVSEFLRTLQIGKSGNTFILERDMHLVATSTPDKLFELDLKTQKIRRLAAHDNENSIIHYAEDYVHDYLGTHQNVQLLPVLQNAQSLDFNLHGEQYFLQVQPYQTAGLDWLIFVVVPAADYLDKINDSKRITLIFIILTSVIAGLMGVLLVSWVTHPLLMLNRAAQKLTVGDWEYELNNYHHRQDEFGQLSRAFEHMVKQLKDLFDNLEAKVMERTHELEQANEEIRALNDYLQADNMRMTAKLDVTREFQRLILPSQTELKTIQELDIAGFMEPAEEVGGDYYDVLSYGDSIKLAIGDVTGHGLASGMLMLMVQTAIRTLYASGMYHPETCLIALNKAIFDNLQRMHSDKNITLSIVDYRRGEVTISGQHEEVLVMRKNGMIERIDTLDLGFPIGIVDNIEHMVSHKNVYLNTGDGLVLYTDGITEAMNAEKDVYGVERLIQIVQKNWSAPANYIQQTIIKDVKKHMVGGTYHDDLTLLIIKRR